MRLVRPTDVGIELPGGIKIKLDGLEVIGGLGLILLIVNEVWVRSPLLRWLGIALLAIWLISVIVAFFRKPSGAE